MQAEWLHQSLILTLYLSLTVSPWLIVKMPQLSSVLGKPEVQV